MVISRAPSIQYRAPKNNPKNEYDSRPNRRKSFGPFLLSRADLIRIKKLVVRTSKIKLFIVSLRPLKNQSMLIIEVKESENIDRALKRSKRKVQQTKILRELRDRKEFKKPSVQRRNQILKAVYKEKKSRDMGL
jgi:small subunit ribosomal protein S21